MTQVLHQNAAMAMYFPRSGSKHASNLLRQELPPQPKSIGPVYDTFSFKEPLSPFDQRAHQEYFTEPSESGEAVPPPVPLDFADRYLIPTLARNERLRLTLLWYHTNSIEKDERLLAEIDTLVRSAQKVIGWEYAVAGIIDESTYRRVGTFNMPLVTVPRRESTCSHTINQKLGSVFIITDMSKDWRFRNSPHVEIGGLRSYAGAPLRLMADNGVEISLGALCVASDTPQESLGRAQRESLISFAELVSSAIANHTRQRRLNKRQEMSDLLSVLRSSVDDEDHEERAIHIIQQAYPGAHISLQVAKDGQIPVEGRSAIPLSEVQGGLWEDAALIEQSIMTLNFNELQPTQTVRAIVARCGSTDKYVVVSGLDIHHVFDNFDAWFIFKSASIIADALQNRLLRKALAAKEVFLRGITHQLRTPLHGVLSSTDLLAEELAARGLLLQSDSNSVSVSPATCIGTIRNSGQELMRTVNSILKYNTWAETTHRTHQSPYDLSCLEDDILPGLLSHVVPEQLYGVSIEFRNELTYTRYIFTDAELLKECVKEVLLNAIQSVTGHSSGTVTLTMCNAEDGTKLFFDIVDNGIGIGIDHQSSIFQPFYKVDSFKLGAGLGLTLASQIASGMQGTVRLVSSSLGTGSHFRIEFKNSLLDVPINPDVALEIILQYLPRTFHIAVSGVGYTHFVNYIARYLEINKFQRSDTSDVGLVIADSNVDELRNAHPLAIIIVLKKPMPNAKILDRPGIFTISGPLHKEILKQILLQGDILYQNLTKEAARQRLRKLELQVPGVESVDTTANAKIAALTVVDSSTSHHDCSDRRVKALLVDDNSINLQILQMFCHKRRIPYATAEDGIKAIEQYTNAAKADDPFTLVLMDLQMPHCDGLEATREIRSYEREHGLPRSFVFMVTGQDWGKDRVASDAAGTDEFLIKPISPAVLDKHISNRFTTYRPAG
ncbi:hypothetical protein F5Y19DRAFT_469447 [Xylariaceae sp. FL1651]|nr:hypothetical protein F5Y19DRAFT_469447 [Xylariaceae sp. FL1651]